MKRIAHESVAMQEIQERRESVRLPNGRRLHSYANLYLYARNKTMSKIRARHRELCVLRIDKSILLEETAIVADQNASSKYVRFSPGLAGLRRIDKETVFAEDWRHPGDQIAEWRHGSAMCAEVLLPDAVPPRYINGLYVSCEDTAHLVRGEFPDMDVLVNGNLFFYVG